MGSPSTLGVSTSAPPAAAPPTDDASDFSKTFAAEFQRHLDEEGWPAGNPAPGKGPG